MHDYEYLAHYGIKGQKWGVRRFQNKDGSLTDQGKLRKRNSLKKMLDGGKKLSPSKRYSKLSDEELERRIKRKQNEIRLADLEFDSSVPAGVRYIKSFVKSGASKGLSAIVGGVVFTYGKKYIEDRYGVSLQKPGK